MKDPMMIQHQAYLNDLESLAKGIGPKTKRAHARRSLTASGRAKMLFVVCAAIVILFPWNSIPI